MLKYLKANIKLFVTHMKPSPCIHHWLLCLVLGGTGASAATADTLKGLPIEGGYRAEYRVYWHGIYAAQAHQKVQRLTTDRYVAHMRVTPRFAFIPFEYDEKSLFFDAGSAIRPIQFTFKWREKKERLKGSVHFDWKKQRRIRSGDSSADTPANLVPLSQDKISLIFQLSRYLENNAPMASGKKWHHSVVEAKKQKTYTFESLPEELLSTPWGLLRSIKIKQSAENSERHSYLWFALDKQYLLLKIAQFKQERLMGYTLIHQLEQE
jgi:hypothetical protein